MGLLDFNEIDEAIKANLTKHKFAMNHSKHTNNENSQDSFWHFNDMGHNKLSLCQNGKIFISGMKEYDCSVCVIGHKNSQSKLFIIHLMPKGKTLLRKHIMFSVNIYSIFLNVIIMKWRKIWNWSQEHSFVFIAFPCPRRWWDFRSPVSVLVNATQAPVGQPLAAYLAMYLCTLVLWIFGTRYFLNIEISRIKETL